MSHPVWINGKYLKGMLLLRVHCYYDGSPLLALSSTAGVRLAEATTLAPKFKLERGEFHVKDWHENQGILDSLVAAGIVVLTGKSSPIIDDGCHDAQVCKLTEAFLAGALAIQPPSVSAQVKVRRAIVGVIKSISRKSPKPTKRTNDHAKRIHSRRNS